MVSIVGAGPGAADLLTVRALQRIQQAEVVLYDNLVSAEILACCQPGALLLYAGKKYGDKVDPVIRQNTINELLVQHAREGKKVVRLKSGDPFIYGRAIEEIRYLREHAVPCEVIPGVTAGLAAAASRFIPLTERSVSNAVLFCTGHTAEYGLDQLDALAHMLRTGTTLVLYMGLSNLQPLLEKLKAIAGGEKLYVSAVSQVSLPGEAIVTEELEEVAAAIEQAKLVLPVVFIIGRRPIGS
jgi:uroporphyrin-III C-methyltransferase